MKQINWKQVLLIVALVFWPMAIGIIAAKANVQQPRYDRFRSRLSGNVVLIPSRCWQEDSLAHLYMHDFDGGKLVLHCHHKGY